MFLNRITNANDEADQNEETEFAEDYLRSSPLRVGNSKPISNGGSPGEAIYESIYVGFVCCLRPAELRSQNVYSRRPNRLKAFQPKIPPVFGCNLA